ncbi:hypothetical protein WJX72_007360 [[Myrmecia] bisecta]|uniref:Peptidase M14 domain-containing protein n=1 Tax=[Myrmecia] bisecta TaxID=41462 RepID=A0AAW1QFL3_9CHLO
MTERKQQQASCKAAPTVKVNSLALQAETKAVPSWLRASLEAAAGRTRQAEGRKQLNDISASDKTVPERNSQQALQAHKPPVTSFTMDVSASLLQQGRWRGGSQELLAGSPQQGSRSASLPVCSTLQAQPFVTTAGSCASPVSARSQVTRAAVVYTSIFVAERPEETAGAARHSFDVESVAADWPPSPDPVGPMRHAPSHLSISRGEVLTARDSLSSPESLGQLRGRVDHLLNYRAPASLLQFCGDFEGGNIGRVQALDGGAEYELMIRPDTLAPRFRLWFHFQVTNCLAGQQVVLSIVNFSKTRSLYRQQMTPVVRSRSHPTWCRLPPSNVFYYRCPKRKMAYVLSMVFTFDKQGELYEFAYSFPYSYTHLQHFLAALAGQQLPYMRRDLLCRSPQLRQVDVITIGDGATAAAAPRRKLVCLTARVHPGETPASYVMEGLLACLADSSPAAQQLRQAATWLLVPMLNPDGCFLGNYRTDAAGVDLNRLWAGPNAALEPALYHVLQLLHRYADDERFELDVFVDIHAHSTTRAGFMFCNPLLPTSASAADMERVCRLPRALDAAMPGFSLAACQWDANACKAGCARRVVGARFPSMLAYTLEISFFNSPPSGTAQISNTGLSTGAASPVAEANTQEGCCEMGRQLALSFLKIYGVDS